MINLKKILATSPETCSITCTETTFYHRSASGTTYDCQTLAIHLFTQLTNQTDLSLPSREAENLDVDKDLKTDARRKVKPIIDDKLLQIRNKLITPNLTNGNNRDRHTWETKGLAIILDINPDERDNILRSAINQIKKNDPNCTALDTALIAASLLADAISSNQNDRPRVSVTSSILEFI